MRSGARLPPGPLLLVNPPRDSLYRQLQTEQRNVQVSTQDFGDYCCLSDSGANVTFDLLPEAGAETALARVVALDGAYNLFDRDVVAVDLRIPERATVRTSRGAITYLRQANSSGGEGQVNE